MPKPEDGSKQLIPPLVSYAVTAAVLAPAVFLFGFFIFSRAERKFAKYV